MTPTCAQRFPHTLYRIIIPQVFTASIDDEHEPLVHEGLRHEVELHPLLRHLAQAGRRDVSSVCQRRVSAACDSGASLGAMSR